MTPSNQGPQGSAQLPDAIRVETAGVVGVQLQRAGTADAPLPLWVAISLHTEHVSFNHFQAFVDRVFCGGDTAAAERGLDELLVELRERRRNPALSPYELLRRAAEVFLLTRAGVWKMPQEAPADVLSAAITIQGPTPHHVPVPREALRLAEHEVPFEELKGRLQALLGTT